MSFKATLKIEGKEYRILNCHYAFHQPYATGGHPIGRVEAGLINLEIESTGDLLIAQWSLSPSAKKSGSIQFHQSASFEQRMKELIFTDAYLVDYAESFSNHGDSPMTERITLTAQAIKLSSGMGSGGEVEHINQLGV